MVGDLTTVIWSVVGCCSGRWSVFSQPLVGGFSDRWSVVPLVGGRLFFRKVVGGAWSVVGGSVSVVGGWSVGGGFVMRWCETYFYLENGKNIHKTEVPKALGARRGATLIGFKPVRSDP